MTGEHREQSAIPEKHPIGHIPASEDVPMLAQKIVALQEKQASEKGGVTPREPEFMEELLRQGLVFYMTDAQNEVVASFYLQPLEENSFYRFGGMISTLSGTLFPLALHQQLDACRDRSLVLKAAKSNGKFFKRQGFEELTTAEFRDRHPELHGAYQASSETHQEDEDRRYYIRFSQ